MLLQRGLPYIHVGRNLFRLGGVGLKRDLHLAARGLLAHARLPTQLARFSRPLWRNAAEKKMLKAAMS